MNFDIALQTDIGKKRKNNQDNGAVFAELGLFIVADGMGGHKGGEIASKIAVETLPLVVKKAQEDKSWDQKKIMTTAIKKANSNIYEQSKVNENLRGMGTTTTAILIKDTKMTIGHVGDSRCYYLRKDSIWQLTRDHSLVQEKLRAGLISRDQIESDLMKNIITRSVGYEAKVDVDLYEMDIKPGDTFLICSDGLSGQVNDSELLKITQKYLFNKKNIQSAVKQMVDSANANGGDDNITVLLVQAGN